jgi:hypothetical protein
VLFHDLLLLVMLLLPLFDHVLPHLLQALLLLLTFSLILVTLLFALLLRAVDPLPFVLRFDSYVVAVITFGDALLFGTLIW